MSLFSIWSKVDLKVIPLIYMLLLVVMPPTRHAKPLVTLSPILLNYTSSSLTPPLVVPFLI